jgi:tetratricopeptide (TPR) repeat protein
VQQPLVPFFLYAADDAVFVDWLRDFLGPDAAPPNRWLERVYSLDVDEPLTWDPVPADSYDVMFAVISEASPNSTQLPDAVLAARRDDKPVFLLRVEGAQPPTALRDVPSVSFPLDWLASLPELHDRLRAITRDAPGSGRPAVGVLTSMPHVLPDDQFRDRHIHSQALTKKLFSDPVGVMVLSGPEGIGKTAMVARILEAMRTGQSWPRWLVYLAADGSAPVSAALLLTLLSRVAPIDTSSDFGPLMLDPDLTAADKLGALLEGLGAAHVLVVLDNVEELLDEDDEFRDVELGELLEILAGETQHQHVKALLITRREPRRLRRPGVVKRFPLDEGLESPYAEEFLQALDRDGSLGLKGANPTVLGHIRELADGNPRALEAFYSILDRGGTSRDELLEDLSGQPGPPQERTRYLVGRMFDGLAHTEQRLIQALAIYGRPVTAEAVDYLIQPYIRLYKSTPELRVLQRRRLIRTEGDRYYLPLADRERVLAGIDRGRPEDRESPVPPETQLALFSHAADFFQQQRKDPGEVVDPRDLFAQLAEIDLRIAAEEYDEALELLHTVDLDYLRPWGYSQLLVPQRLQINSNISDQHAKLANLDALGNATQQQDELEEAKGYLSRAVALAEELDDACDLARSYINLGTAYLEDSEPSRAVTRFEMALRLAEQHDLRTEEAHARANLSNCYGYMGRLDEALEQHKQTLRLIEQVKHAAATEVDQETADREEMGALEVQVVLSIGELHGRRGEPDAALSYLTTGHQLAREQGEDLFEGELLISSAEAEIDRGDIQKAIELATAAIEIGKPRRNPQLLQNAYSILALAQLEDGNIPGAQAAASIAARYPRRRGRLEPFVLAGIVELLSGSHGLGFDAFNWVDLRARRLREQDPHNISVLDPHGLALCGLTLCGAGDYVQKATATFRQAREASSQVGMAKRTLRLLDQMALVDPAGLLDPARAAAGP